MSIAPEATSRTRAKSAWRLEMLDWLLSDRVLGADGAVYSWHNPLKPGYAYPEIGGYLLAYQDAVPQPEQARIARWLAAQIDLHGGGGRDGLFYLFDTAIILHGLLVHRQAGGEVDSRILTRAYSFIANSIVARGAVYDSAGRIVNGDAWSLSFGCHLLKVVRSLSVYHQLIGHSECLTLIEQLLDDLCPLYEGGRFQVSATMKATQLHAHCYALEGLLAYLHLAPSPRSNVASVLQGGADWLAVMQRSDGSLPEWYDGRTAWGSCRADVAAQAIRIWCALDADCYRASCARAVNFLRRLHVPGSGLRFEPASFDVNTWATIFAVQALDWLESPRPAEII